jgi:hypothetical protein
MSGPQPEGRPVWAGPSLDPWGPSSVGPTPTDRQYADRDPEARTGPPPDVQSQVVAAARTCQGLGEQVVNHRVQIMRSSGRHAGKPEDYGENQSAAMSSPDGEISHLSLPLTCAL